MKDIKYESNNNCDRLIKIIDGLKVVMREDALKEAQNNVQLLENFNLKIKRLNRWWYSIYFEEKIKSK